VQKAVDCALAIVGHTTAEAHLIDQVTLLLRHGGLGLSRASPALGSSAAAHIVMRNGPEAFRPFDGPSAMCSGPCGKPYTARRETSGSPS
jgi:hypothetical protein